MTSAIDTAEEQRRIKRAILVCRVADGGLADAVKQAGGYLQGFSMKLSGADCLMTMRITMPAGPMVSFVGSETIAGCLLKAYREARSDDLKFKPDQWAERTG